MSVLGCICCYLPAKSQLTGNIQRFEAPDATSAMKHDVFVILPRSLHCKYLLKVFRGQLQRLLQDPH